MSISLVSVRNAQWKTKKRPRYDQETELNILDSNGDLIFDVVNDENGDPMKEIDCLAIWTTSEANVHLPVNWSTFTIDATSVEQHLKDLYTALVNGDHGAITAEEE